MDIEGFGGHSCTPLSHKRARKALHCFPTQLPTADLSPSALPVFSSLPRPFGLCSFTNHGRLREVESRDPRASSRLQISLKRRPQPLARCWRTTHDRILFSSALVLAATYCPSLRTRTRARLRSFLRLRCLSDKLAGSGGWAGREASGRYTHTHAFGSPEHPHSAGPTPSLAFLFLPGSLPLPLPRLGLLLC